MLRLVADGATNAQVAERLFLSIRTVETHVANLLRRTDSANREELGAWVTRPDRPRNSVVTTDPPGLRCPDAGSHPGACASAPQ